MDHLWLRRYELWLRRQGRAENTIGIRFRTLRMLFNQAIERDYALMEQYPFKSYKVGKLHEETQKRAISKAEVKAVMDFPCEGRNFYTRLAIDLFSFSYLMGGINFVDMANLTPQNIIDGRLVYRRQKTGKLLNLPLQERAKMIIAHYSSESGYLFPIYTREHKTVQQKLNRHHKVITKVNRALFPENLKIIGSRGFYGCRSLTSISLPISLSSIGAEVFYECNNLVQLTFSGQDIFNNNVFSTYNNIKNVVVAEGVVSLGRFLWGANVLTITLPKSLTSIAAYTFQACTRLQEITCYAIGVPTLTGNPFASTFSKLYVPSESLAKYRNSNWVWCCSQILPIKE